MRNKIITTLVIVFCLVIGVHATSAFDIGSCGTMGMENGHYHLSQNVGSFETCFIIENDGIILDCDNNRVTSMSGDGYGIYVKDSRNVEIRNCIIEDFGQGIYIDENSDADIINSRSIKIINGDSNLDGSLDISDAIHILNYLFIAGPKPIDLNRADFNDDGEVDISDAIAILYWIT